MALLDLSPGMHTRIALGTAVATGLATLLVMAATLAAPAPDAPAVPGMLHPALAPSLLVGAAGLIAVVVVFQTTRWLLRRELQALNQLAAAIDDVELDGSPLYRNLPQRGPVEVERIVGAWNGFALRFDILMREMRERTTRLNEATKELAAAGPHAARRAQQQADALRQLAALVECLAAKERGDDAAPSQAAVAAAARATHLADSLQTLADAGGRAKHVLQTIDDFAFRTNVLALTAAIEAARAGAPGQSFAAIAERFRLLAKESADAARADAAAFAQAAEAAARGAADAAALRHDLTTIAAPASGTLRGGADADAAAAAQLAQRLLGEASTVAQRTRDLVEVAVAAAAAAAEVEARVWPPPDVDDRDIVALGDPLPATATD